MTDVQLALATLIPTIESISDVRSIGGGCISDARRVCARDRDGQTRSLFVKANANSFLENFQAEWDGLIRLHEVGVIGVPRPLAVGIAADRSWLVTEWIDQGRRESDFFARFGRALAALHRQTLGTRIGLDHNNFLGSAPQLNTPTETWAEFVAEHRIGFQIRWAVDQGLTDSGLQRDCEQIVERMHELLEGRDETTSLLHGDLWSGNYLCRADGMPVIIDPAIYYGCREAEFGMLRLFGSCGGDFYDAYDEAFPLPAGWHRRTSVYVLYHLLNHLNLFGSGYLDQSRRLAAEIVRS